MEVANINIVSIFEANQELEICKETTTTDITTMELLSTTTNKEGGRIVALRGWMILRTRVMGWSKN